MVVKVACCGGQLVHSNHPHTSLGHPPAGAPDSCTDGLEYPDRLQRVLGAAGYEVVNFGAASCFVCPANEAAAGPKDPTVVYQKTAAAQECLDFEPDIVVLGPFGKHDALSPSGWGTAEEKLGYERAPNFTADDWAAGLQEMAAHLGARGATVVLALPVPFPSGSTTHALATSAVPATRSAAATGGLAVVDTYTPFAGNAAVFPDADHLNNAGTDLLAEAVAATVKEVVGLAGRWRQKL
eukprot:SAG22_NODE_41_length_25488_cov_6.133719_14_plen_239_part_00